MKFAEFSLIYLLFLADNVTASGKTILENINLIVGIVVGIATVAGVIIAYFALRGDKKEKPSPEKKKLPFPLEHSLNNQTPPEVNFVGRTDMLGTITDWFANSKVRIGAVIGWGGVGKSALVRKWYDELESNNIRPDGVFWWGFYRNAYLERFLEALLEYLSQGRFDLKEIKSTWAKVDKIKELINEGRYLIILDGLEEMQKGEAGDEFGKMIHSEFKELLHYLADTKSPGGLCLITTRYPLKDIDKWHEHSYEYEPLVDLSIPDAILMLRKRGIKGTDEKLKEVVKRYKGHALSLTSVAGYLTRHCHSDIKQAPDIVFVMGDKKRFKDVNKLLRKYAEKMSTEERVFLNIFSLFRQEVTEDDFTGVFRKKTEDAEFNDVLVKMSDLDFDDLLSGLVDWRLISYDEMKENYSTHPLIKSYFESIFEQEDKKLCHKRIYQYIGGYAPERPETLEQMQPLFEQVYHGCAAGLYDEAWWDVYWERIHRKEEHLIIYKLGAWETDLSIAKTFFTEGDLLQMPLVSNKGDQSWLLNEAGLALLCTGRPKEAEELLIKKTNMQIENKDWKNASSGYSVLADLSFRTGELEVGLESAKKALEMAEKAEKKDYIVSSRGYLGWILYLLGTTEEAEKEFREADELGMKVDGNRLYGQRGVRYANFLRAMERIDKAFEITKQNLEICKSQNWRDDLSKCHRCLGAIERTKGNYKEAENHIQTALEIGRKVGMPFLQIETLLERGRLRLDIEKYQDAIRDSNEVLKICGRTGFRLYEPEAEVVLAKAYLAGKDTEEAEKYGRSAYEKAAGMHYRWAEGDGAHLLGEIYSAKGDKGLAGEWIKKAIAVRKEISDPKAEESEKMLENL